MADKKPDEKRALKLGSFEELFTEIERLCENGYQSKGNWNLAQTCGHIGNWMRYPIDGFPVPPLFMKPVFWILKVTVGQSMKRKILSEGFKGGVPTAPESVPSPGASDDRAAAEELRKTVERVRSHTGELLPSPFFGPMDLETLETVTLLHAAHHLAYLHPNS